MLWTINFKIASFAERMRPAGVPWLWSMRPHTDPGQYSVQSIRVLLPRHINNLAGCMATAGTLICLLHLHSYGFLGEEFLPRAPLGASIQLRLLLFGESIAFVNI